MQDKTLMIRISTKDKEDWEQAAGIEGKNLSQFIRDIVNGNLHPGGTIYGIEMNQQYILEELKKIGKIINEILYKEFGEHGKGVIY